MTTMNPTQLWQYINDNAVDITGVDAVFCEATEDDELGHFKTAAGVTLTVEEACDAFHLPRTILEIEEDNTNLGHHPH